MKIGGRDDLPFNNPFQNQNVQNLNSNQSVENAGNTNSLEGSNKISSPNEIHKPEAEEGASANMGGQNNPQAQIGRSQFTNENDIQEIDIQEFEDDFK